jgi:hypothetical protein
MLTGILEIAMLENKWPPTWNKPHREGIPHYCLGGRFCILEKRIGRCHEDHAIESDRAKLDKGESETG